MKKKPNKLNQTIFQLENNIYLTQSKFLICFWQVWHKQME